MLVTSGGFQGFSRRFLSFEISKVGTSLCVTIYIIMYNITTVKIYCQKKLEFTSLLVVELLIYC